MQSSDYCKIDEVGTARVCAWVCVGGGGWLMTRGRAQVSYLQSKQLILNAIFIVAKGFLSLLFKFTVQMSSL